MLRFACRGSALESVYGDVNWVSVHDECEVLCV